MKMEMTNHAQYYRRNRIQFIQQEIGFGQEIKRIWWRETWNCLTDTGICIVRDASCEKIITIYIPTAAALSKFYNGNVKKIPPYLRKKVDHNQSLYIKDGKTIVAD